MTPAQLRQAAGLGAWWQQTWEGMHLLPNVEQICSGLHGPGGAYRREYRCLAYAPTPTPGIEAGRCERCRIAWVRAADL